MPLNPELFVWARNQAGLSVDEAAGELDFKDTRTRTAARRLADIEAGEEEPSRSVLLKMSKAYRRSLLVFYLPEPPRIGDRGKDFRTTPGAPPPLYNPILDTLIRDIRGRQSIVQGLLEDADPKAVDFVGSVSISLPAENLARRIAERFKFSLEEFRAPPTVEKSFIYLREKIEAAGVYVLLLGNLGSHHTNISVEIFRGFAIADRIAPFIVVNDQDAHAAWCFTALHEVAHLWLGETGVSSKSVDARIERYCNDVAGEILLPSEEIRREFAQIRRMTLDDASEAIAVFARGRKISRDMVAYKLLRTDMVARATWRELAERFSREWIDSRARQEDQDREHSEGGPSYYVVRRHRLGNALLGLVRRSLGEGVITHTKAGRVLGVKARNVDPLLDPQPGAR